MAVWYFAPTQTMGNTQHVAHDTVSLTTTSAVLAGEFYAFSNIELPIAAQFSNTHYTITAGQTGDQTVTYPVDFICTPVADNEFSVGFYNLTGGTIPTDTLFDVAYTCIGD
jgi:hypothetical protein